MTMTRIVTSTVDTITTTIDTAMDPATDPETGPPELLPEPELHRMQISGDIGAMIAALLIETSKSSRDIARSVRDTAAAAEDAAHASKIRHMQDAADARLVGGLTSGGLTIAAGVAAGGGEVRRNALLAKSEKSLEGGATVADSIAKFSATESDIEKEHAERAQAQAKRNVESASDLEKDSRDLLRRAMSHYADYVRAKDDASKAALFRA